MKWKLALKFVNEFDYKKVLTKINDPEGGDVYIYFSPNEKMKTILKTCPLLTNSNGIISGTKHLSQLKQIP